MHPSASIVWNGIAKPRGWLAAKGQRSEMFRDGAKCRDRQKQQRADNHDRTHQKKGECRSVVAHGP